ncbi:2-oxo acid dehydrogenase subunit E2 [Luteimonas sp. XNQY3]|nr:dihydrolipoamide acetyltransferase family protein [Luteimonas sp. XNQY3]MCD9006322.1 2-oxo acid dehydrogenase subunit E2 [Luteimonas sp. XNQY3]
MGHHVIKMPDIGEGIAEVEVIAWKVEVGGPVAEDQVVAEVMTDKAMVEIPSPVAGTVVSLGGKPGEMMAVGSELIRLEVEGAGNLKPGLGIGESGLEEAAPDPAKPAEPKTEAPKVEAPKPGPAKAESAKAPAVSNHQSPITNHRGAVTNGVLSTGEATLASPAVRRRAWDLGIELRYVPATGPGGRILHADLDAYAAAGGKAQPVGAGAGGSSYVRRTGEEQVPIMGLRRKIAQKMQQSWSNIPHITYVEEIDVTEVEALRAKLNERWGKTRGKLTLLPLLARAVVLAARDFPQMNARFDDEANIVTRYEGVQLGIATQSAVGLSVPVIAHAESLDLWQTAAEIARLATAVREGKATRDELSGSTITISSLGPVGGVVSTPIINHPEVAIVGVNRIIERPMFREGQVVARKLMNLSSSFDHRIVDGMDAAEFVQAIRRRIETPALLFVE